MIAPGATWAFLGLFTGVGKAAFVAALALLLFGRPGALRHVAPRVLRPFLPTARPGGGSKPWLGRRGVLALKILGWTALAAWVATRATRIGPAHSPR